MFWQILLFFLAGYGALTLAIGLGYAVYMVCTYDGAIFGEEVLYFKPKKDPYYGSGKSVSEREWIYIVLTFFSAFWQAATKWPKLLFDFVSDKARKEPIV